MAGRQITNRCRTHTHTEQTISVCVYRTQKSIRPQISHRKSSIKINNILHYQSSFAVCAYVYTQYIQLYIMSDMSGAQQVRASAS